MQEIKRKRRKKKKKGSALKNDNETDSDRCDTNDFKNRDSDNQDGGNKKN